MTKEKTGISGPGYVVLPSVHIFCEAWLRVPGFDIEQDKINMLQKGKSYISYIPGKRIEQHRHSQ